jgi:Restriction endonuclease
LRSVIPPYYLELVSDAARKSFWRKGKLAVFLRRCHISDKFLATWHADESKRDFLDRLFPLLEAEGDKGLRLINGMADALIQQATFPDLQGWEDTKQKIEDAKASVAALKDYRESQQQQATTLREQREAKERAQAIQAEIRSRQTSLSTLDEELKELYRELGTKEGGYRFQDWFYKLADHFEVISRRPYNSKGRQIDGSLTIEGTTYLVELKYMAKQAGATDVDSLHTKVNSKADNTMGVMFSMSGFSSVAKSQASGARGLLLLFDHEHIYLMLTGSCTLQDLVSRVRRHAAQTGEAYLGASTCAR